MNKGRWNRCLSRHRSVTVTSRYRSAARWKNVRLGRGGVAAKESRHHTTPAAEQAAGVRRTAAAREGHSHKLPATPSSGGPREAPRIHIHPRCHLVFLDPRSPTLPHQTHIDPTTPGPQIDIFPLIYSSLYYHLPSSVLLSLSTQPASTNCFMCHR
jgi:hypothetical protein